MYDYPIILLRTGRGGFNAAPQVSSAVHEGGQYFALAFWAGNWLTKAGMVAQWSGGCYVKNAVILQILTNTNGKCYSFTY
jgi:hypothetical protein